MAPLRTFSSETERTFFTASGRAVRRIDHVRHTSTDRNSATGLVVHQHDRYNITTDLRTGNNDEYPKRLDPRLPAGVEMKVLGERGGWLHVELSGGAVGWVPRARVAEVY